MKTWEDVVETEFQKKKWRSRFMTLQSLEQPFTIPQIAEAWGISRTATRTKLTSLEKKHPLFIYRNTFQKDHLITFNWGEEITFEPPPSTVEVEVKIPKIIKVPSPEFLRDREEAERGLRMPKPYTEQAPSPILPSFLRERAYTETIKKLEGMNPSVLTPESKVTFERLAWREKRQRGQLKVIVTTGKDKLAMTCLYDNGFPVSALIKVE